MAPFFLCGNSGKLIGIMFSLFRLPRRLSLLLVGSLALVLLPRSASAATAATPLRCAPCALRFGSVKVAQSKTLTVALTNTRSLPVTISSMRQSAPGFAIRGLVEPVTLGAGKTVSFSIVFAPRDNRTIQGGFKFVSPGSTSTLGNIYVSGTGLTSGSLRASPTSINFGNVPLGKGALRTQTLTNSGSTNVTIIGASAAGGSWISGIATPMTLRPGTSITFYAHFNPRSVGPVSGKISIASSATDYQLLIPFTGNATGSGQLSVSPPNVNFGGVVVGSSKSTIATLSAISAAVTIDSGSLSSSEFSVKGLSMPLTLGAGQTKSFTIAFTPQSSGAASASLSFKTGTVGTNAVVSASLTGSGIAAPQHSASLSWKPSNSQVIGYNIYRGRQSGGPYTQLNSVMEARTTYTDDNVQGGQTYFYVVKAVEGSGKESAYSNQAQAAIPSP
jgi:Abnormal spindle-like microcephaly-assoc'd, ASPM-SPD-2-Hydin